MTDGWTMASSERLDAAGAATAVTLVDQAAAEDGFSALNEAGLLHLRHPRPGVRHVLIGSSERLDGYAQLAAEGAASTGQLVVHPGQRRRGLGTALLDELVRRAPAPLQIWALGDSAAARGLAEQRGLVRARELLVMTRSLAESVPVPPLPPGVSLRTFVPGVDETEWLSVNARAFASHPEQGRLTHADLDERMAEDWFDPAGFFLAVSDGPGTQPAMLGFHWTKQHPDGLGEVYVLGVDPDHDGRGLGRALLARGLVHLQGHGNHTVELYVEGDHERAVSLYERNGFTAASRDVMYAQP